MIAANNEGNVLRSGSEAGRSDEVGHRSAPGRGVVGGRSGRRKVASEQAAQGPAAKLVGVDENAVIKGEKKATSLPSPPLPEV